MCFMDWRIGRLIRSVQHKTSGNNITPLDLPPNQQRVALTVFPTAAQVAGAFVNTPLFVIPIDALGNVIGANGFVFDMPLHITLATHGDLPTKGWRVLLANNVSADALVIEYLVPESLLTLGLQLLQRDYPGLA